MMPTMSTIFKPAARYPADPRAIFILVLSIFTGFTAVALQTGPPSLEAVMPLWAVLAWGILLAVGSAVTMIGMYFQSINGIITEQIGSVIVAATTLFYAGVAFWQIGFGALQAVGIILAWGLSCGLRWFQLQSLLRDAAARQAKLARLAALDVDLEARRSAEMARRRFTVDEHDSLGKWGTQ